MGMTADRTLYLRNITADIKEPLLYELFLQAGPVEDVAIKGNIAFVTFEDEESVLYACSLFEGIKLYGNEIVVRPRAGSKFAGCHIRSVTPYANNANVLPPYFRGRERHMPLHQSLASPGIAAILPQFVRDVKNFSGTGSLCPNVPYQHPSHSTPGFGLHSGLLGTRPSDARLLGGHSSTPNVRISYYRSQNTFSHTSGELARSSMQDNFSGSRGSESHHVGRSRDRSPFRGRSPSPNSSVIGHHSRNDHHRASPSGDHRGREAIPYSNRSRY
ncbi:unnamed protein product [Calicophoron daubneyi]|uniref:RRM domain-containing protein n=1 Tax=Calicophoron daubneyi TaxID=300641 RepID=A0AAV2T7I8_CALDB